MDKTVEHIEHFNFVMVTGLGEGKLRIQTRLKTDFVSNLFVVEGLNKYSQTQILCGNGFHDEKQLQE